MIIFRIKIYLNKLWNYAVNRWPLGRTHTALEECVFLAEQSEHRWKQKRVLGLLTPVEEVVWGGGEELLATEHCQGMRG